MRIMEIIVKLGYRLYVFYKQSDASKAERLFGDCWDDQECFEKELEENDIDFSYEIL